MYVLSSFDGLASLVSWRSGVQCSSAISSCGHWSVIQFAVQQLVAVPHGSMVELGIHHPVLAESDFSSDSSSSSPLPTSPRDLDHDPQTFQTRDMELPHGMQMQGDSRAANVCMYMYICVCVCYIQGSVRLKIS